MNVIVAIYGCIFFAGIIGNGSLILALFYGPGSRNRSPLLLGLIAADFLVCTVSGPVTAALYNYKLNDTIKRLAIFCQALPISASTLSMMAISVDRYLTVKNYRPADQAFKRRRFLFGIVVAIWLLAALLSVPAALPENQYSKLIKMVVAVLVHIIPACAVIISHIGVHAKLTALSLTARAKHGELPLPMPLLRKPTHVIIVAGVQKAEAGLPKQDDEVEDEPEAPTSTLESRRRLANCLLWMAGFFTVFWLPHVTCDFCDNLEVPVVPDIEHYCLILGHIHSALSPCIYWSLNYKWLNNPCSIHFPGLYRSPSSTNEANLGPFNPRYVRPPQQNPPSSHYLY